MKALIAAVATAALAGCTALTAEAPLFTPADQLGPAPLMEGVWIQINDECPARHARRRGRLPAACSPSELRRLPDDAWLFKFQDHVQFGEPEPGEPEPPRAYRVIIAPATENRASDAYAPLYVAEYQPLEPAEPVKPHYAVIAPIGEKPARQFYLIAEIACAPSLRDGPIEGIAVTRDERGDIESCVAAHQAAVREAARRTTIENLSSMLGETPDGGRWVFVRP